MLIVDYFSKYPEVISASSETAGTTIKVVQAVFSRHELPNTVVADNMPFNSAEFKDFAKLGSSPLLQLIKTFPNPVDLLTGMFKLSKECSKRPKTVTPG